jgi:hypothetical protein
LNERVGNIEVNDLFGAEVGRIFKVCKKYGNLMEMRGGGS